VAFFSSAAASLREQLDGVGRRVGRADVHPVERRAEIALVVGGGGA
jgi:hypothetical protein